MRLIDVVTAGAVVLALVVGGLLLRQERIAGTVFVVDGDTIDLGGRRVRLRGLDAPELGQTCQRGPAPYRCGDDARAFLRTMVTGRTVTCSLRGRDRYDRALGTCTVEGQDIGASLVRSGMAVAAGAYHDEEDAARATRRGVWAGPFEMPGAWRRRHAAEKS